MRRSWLLHYDLSLPGMVRAQHRKVFDAADGGWRFSQPSAKASSLLTEAPSLVCCNAYHRQHKCHRTPLDCRLGLHSYSPLECVPVATDVTTAIELTSRHLGCTSNVPYTGIYVHVPCRLAATIAYASAQIQTSLLRWSQAAVCGLRTGSAPRLPLPPMAQQRPHFANLLARDSGPCSWPACQRLFSMCDYGPELCNQD